MRSADHRSARNINLMTGTRRYRTARRRIVGSLVLLGLMLTTWQTLAEEGPRSVRRIVYDYAVTSYCGLLTAEVEFGFKQELAAVTQRSGLSEAEAKSLRIAGWVDADREWSNRGLGGFRAWCREDGLPAARRFLDYTAG